MKTYRLAFAAFAAWLLVPEGTLVQAASWEFRDTYKQRATRDSLQRDYPAGVSPKLDRATKSADAIVGWYDKGHNYHAQKMGSRFTPKERFEQRMRLRGRALEQQKQLQQQQQIR